MGQYLIEMTSVGWFINLLNPKCLFWWGSIVCLYSRGSERILRPHQGIFSTPNWVDAVVAGPTSIFHHDRMLRFAFMKTTENGLHDCELGNAIAMTTFLINSIAELGHRYWMKGHWTRSRLMNHKWNPGVLWSEWELSLVILVILILVLHILKGQLLKAIWELNYGRTLVFFVGTYWRIAWEHSGGS